MTYLDFNGTQCPIHFGFGALYQYEKNTGRSAIGDFTTNSNGENISVTFIVNLAHSGFLCGASVEKKPFQFNDDDVAAWLTPDRVAKVMELFMDSMPAGEAGEVKPKRAKR